MRRATWILSSVSVLLVAAGAVSKFAVYPGLHQMPDDAEGTMKFQGTITALDPQAMAKGDFANAIIRDLPVTADRKVKAVHTAGSTIVLNDRTEVFGPTGAVVSTSEHQYAVDRRNLLERPTPKGAQAEPHTGLSAGFPLTPEKRDYPFWDSETQTTVPARYDGSEDREGRKVYIYRIVAQGPLADKAVKDALPAALPKTALLAINPAAPLASQPDVVPLEYVSTTNMTGYVDAETGVTIALESSKGITATAQGTEVFPVAKASLTTTKASERDLADTAATGALVFWILSDAGPYGMWALALVLVLLAVWLELRQRRSPVPADGGGAVPRPRDSEPDGVEARELNAVEPEATREHRP
ncbi:porin PorA family protein [Yinghuangia sp. YIM S09857]|uniref:porin PorA family protein n=1 Tax=Yinghuangia sp. YIM S09857 TaxID=3436929 RepID=UPI003F52F9B0